MATKTPSSSTDLLDKQMLNLVQSHFPMSERPYAEMAEQLGTPTATAIMGAATLVFSLLVILTVTALRRSHQIHTLDTSPAVRPFGDDPSRSAC